jgi:branched-chain amino acid transport system substrate-binding protein
MRPNLEVGGQQAVDMVIPVPWHNNGNPGSGPLQESLDRAVGGDVNWRTAIFYDAVQALAGSPSQRDPTSIWSSASHCLPDSRRRAGQRRCDFAIGRS